MRLIRRLTQLLIAFSFALVVLLASLFGKNAAYAFSAGYTACQNNPTANCFQCRAVNPGSGSNQYDWSVQINNCLSPAIADPTCVGKKNKDMLEYIQGNPSGGTKYIPCLTQAQQPSLSQGDSCDGNQSQCGSLDCRPYTEKSYNDKAKNFCLFTAGTLKDDGTPCVVGSNECGTQSITGAQLGCMPQTGNKAGQGICQCPSSGCPKSAPPVAADNTPPFSFCDQANPADKPACIVCSGDKDHPTGKIWTSIGCLPTDIQGIVQSLLTVGLGLSGGVVLLTILSGSFMFATSAGEPKKVQEAQEMISAAVIGLLFVIFSVVILNFVGVTILHIPGFS